MAAVPNYSDHDGVGLAALVRCGEVKASELLEAAIERREAVNPRINAVVRTMDDEARASIAAGEQDGPFMGVPFLIKDLLAAYRGVPTNCGSRAFDGYVPESDSELVARFKRAGLVIFGKTNTPELGLMGVTEPRRFGATRNPWDLTRSSGGSSGGSAAAVAAGIVPLAHGNDGGGSLRIPASFCGLVGLKPSRGRNPLGPQPGEPWFGQVQDGVLSRSVRDTAVALDATWGPDVGAPYTTPAPARPFAEEVGAPVERLRIAWTAQPLMRRGDIHSECVAALHRCVEQLRALGHELVEDCPLLDREALGEGYLLRIMSAVAADLEEAQLRLGRRLRADEFEDETWALARLGQAYRAGDLELANRRLQAQSRVFGAFMQHYDLFLTPTLGEPPVAQGEFRVHGVEKFGAVLARYMSLGSLPRRLRLLPQLIEQNFRFVTATPLANICGNPSISLPLQWSAEGLPIGMMFTARYLDESLLLRFAAQLERELPWAERRPPL